MQKKFGHLVALLALSLMIAENKAWAQDDLGKIFDDQGEDFGGMPPGDPFGGGGQNGFNGGPNFNGQPQNPPTGTFTPPPQPQDNGGSNDNGSSFGGSKGSGQIFKTKPKTGPKTTTSSQNAPRPIRPGQKNSMAFAEPEDITNENFPDLIDSFDYPNADITDIVKAISQLTKKNFIIDSGVHGKISIVAPTQITVAEAYKAFLSALASNGLTVVPSGKFLKIKPADAAKRDSIETYTGAYFPNSDILITRIIHLNHISAEEVQKQLLRILPSGKGELTAYPPTNSLIISDYGANIERITRILDQLDKPGFDEVLAVVPIRYAKAKDVADLINKIINKDSGNFNNPGGFGAVRPFRPTTGGKPEELSLVQPDERTNAIIVLGNTAGIEKARNLVRKLDYKLDPASAGGVFVYYVKYGEAEKIAQTLNGLATGAASTSSSSSSSSANSGFGSPLGPGFGSPTKNSPLDKQTIFGGDVKIVADKNTNSLVITASAIDYQTVEDLLKKLDIPRDQVFISGVIMELATDKQRSWNLAYYNFGPGVNGASSGVPRMGFAGAQGTLANILNPANDAGAILGFGTGGPLQLTIPGSSVGTVTIPSFVAFLNWLQTNTENNVLSTPQLLVTDNEEGTVEVGIEAPVSNSTATTGSTTTTSQQRENLTTKLTVTPLIRPGSEAVRLKVELPIKALTQTTIAATNLAQNSIAVTTRNIKTNIVVQNGDTAVLGGLMQDNVKISETKVPILGDIPILGWLFKSTQNQKQKLNLLVFLTPKIIRNTTDSQKNLVHVAKKRIDWVKQNFGGRDPYGQVMDELPRAEIPENEVEGAARKNDEKVEPIRTRQ